MFQELLHHQSNLRVSKTHVLLLGIHGVIALQTVWIFGIYHLGMHLSSFTPPQKELLGESHSLLLFF